MINIESKLGTIDMTLLDLLSYGKDMENKPLRVIIRDCRIRRLGDCVPYYDGGSGKGEKIYDCDQCLFFQTDIRKIAEFFLDERSGHLSESGTFNGDPVRLFRTPAMFTHHPYLIMANLFTGQITAGVMSNTHLSRNFEPRSFGVSKLRDDALARLEE
jgi:hypothetical protein